MPTSTVDRRVLSALAAAAHRLEALQPEAPIAAQFADAARQLVARAGTRLQDAMDAEDKEELEAVRAADRRREAFDALGDAFGRLYSGLTAGVALAAMRGERSATLDDLRAYLDETNPSTFRGKGFQSSLSIFRIARRWADQYLPAEGGAQVVADVDPVLAAAQAAFAEAEKEAGESATAFRELEAAREASRRDYLAARSATLAVLNLTGTSDQINRYMPSLDRVLRAPGGNATADDDVSPLFEAPTEVPGDDPLA